MSVFSTLALVTSAVIARLKPAREVELEAQIDDLKRQLEVAREEARSWERLTNNWRARYERQLEPYIGAPAQSMPLMNPAFQQQNMNMARYNQHLNQGVLNPFNSELAAFCNCVPSRSQVLPLNRGD